MNERKHKMLKSQQVLLAVILLILVLEIVLTAFFISFSSFIFKGLSIVHGLLIVVFISRQIKRKGM
ncbi:TPA: hypothetical protein R1907_001431 [Staphylococcus delphini]|uniref:hypothetical protein n=1 Tax=Staphylococcus delphini TaxID=53344 RepID=UPI000BBC5D0A|nr:hypothetical protein [Staphylococcus delphini]HEC2155723.1 hypothetical protein [Staphylococcus delphini]HEC2175746.1 hypothetical protein [Staphylococcus delphini]